MTRFPHTLLRGHGIKDIGRGYSTFTSLVALGSVR
jgi:hypothetical protein